MTDEASLVQKFTSFLHEVFPLFGIKDVSQAEGDIAEPKNIHTFLYFLQSPDNRALIVNVKTSENGSKRFYFYLNPRDVGNVQSGFTLIKKADFDLSRRFKNVFHAINLEPFLVTRIDALLFDELLQSMNPQLTTVKELEPIFTFGQEDAIISPSQQATLMEPLQNSPSEKYISIQEPQDGINDSFTREPPKITASPKPSKPEAKPPVVSKNGRFINRLSSKESADEDDNNVLKYRP